MLTSLLPPPPTTYKFLQLYNAFKVIVGSAVSWSETKVVASMCTLPRNSKIKRSEGKIMAVLKLRIYSSDDRAMGHSRPPPVIEHPTLGCGRHRALQG